MCIAEGDPSTILLRKIASGTAQDDSGGRLPFSETLIIKRRGAPMCAPVLRCKAEASLKRKPPPLLVMGEVSAKLTEGAHASSIQRLVRKLIAD